MKKGDKVEIGGIRGVIQRIKDGIAYVEMKHPIHLMDIPDDTYRHLADDKITTKMAEATTNRLGIGTAQLLEDIGRLPAGAWTGPRGESTYTLKKSMKLSAIEDLCMQTHEGSPFCWLQSAYLNVIPIKV